MNIKKITGYLFALILIFAVLFVPGCAKQNDDQNNQTANVTTIESTTQVPDEDPSSEEQSTEEDIEQETYDIEDDTLEDETIPPIEDQIPENGEYTTLEQVSTYIHLYGHLPDNYITKDEAKKLGWDAGKGNLWDVAPGACIGGDRFGNYEGLLPEKKGRQYFECDVDYEGGKRGAQRVVYSNDGLVYYTADHYESFVLFFGEE